VKDVLHFSVSVPFSAWAAINRDLEIRHLIVNRPKAVRSGCSNQRLARKLEPQAACFYLAVVDSLPGLGQKDRMLCGHEYLM